jgi:hypothetical protein
MSLNSQLMHGFLLQLKELSSKEIASRELDELREVALIVVDGLTMLSRWLCRIIEQSSWFYAHPSQQGEKDDMSEQSGFNYKKVRQSYYYYYLLAM